MTNTPPSSSPPPATFEIVAPVPNVEHGPLVFPRLPGGPEHPPAGAVPEGYEAAVNELLAGAWAENSRRAYRTGLKRFFSWCGVVGARPAPAEPATIAAFIARLVHEGVAYGTVGVYVAAIRFLHYRRGLYLPTRHPVVLDAMKSAQRQLGLLPKNRKAAVTWDQLPAMVRTIDRTMAAGARDAALLLLGYAGGFRRSELVSIRLHDVALGEKGLWVFLPRSKADQEGRGARVEVERNHRDPELCPVVGVERWIAVMWGERWLNAAKTQEAFLFPSGKDTLRIPFRAAKVALLVKRCAKAAGMKAESYSSHSLRSGHVTSAVRAGVADSVVQQSVRHRTPAMVAVYRREAEPFAGGVGQAIYGEAK